RFADIAELAQALRSAPPPEPRPEARPETQPATQPDPEPRPAPPPAPAPAKPKSSGRLLAELIGDDPGRTAQVVATLRQVIERLRAMSEEGLHHAPLSPESIRALDDGGVSIDAAPPPAPGQTVA